MYSFSSRKSSRFSSECCSDTTHCSKNASLALESTVAISSSIQTPVTALVATSIMSRSGSLNISNTPRKSLGREPKNLPANEEPEKRATSTKYSSRPMNSSPFASASISDSTQLSSSSTESRPSRMTEKACSVRSHM